MPSFYRLVRYVPDPVADERLNLGVAVYGDGKVRLAFSRDLRRARVFGGEDSSFIQHALEDLRRAQGHLFSANLTEANLDEIARRWKNAIQFSEQRSSLKTPDELLHEMVSRFDLARTHHPKPRRGRRTVVAQGLKALRSALLRSGEQKTRFAKENIDVAGSLESHTFDLGLANGHTLLAADALSFQIEGQESLDERIDAVKWAIDDVKKRARKLPIAVLVIPPKDNPAGYDRAKGVFERLDAEVVEESDFENWALEAVARVGV